MKANECATLIVLGDGDIGVSYGQRPDNPPFLLLTKYNKPIKPGDSFFDDDGNIMKGFEAVGMSVALEFKTVTSLMTVARALTRIADLLEGNNEATP